MIFTAIQYTIISLVVIAIFHYLISHFTNNLTVPKVRDLVSDTNAQYETILKQLESGKKSGTKVSSVSMTQATKQDLKDYLKCQSPNIQSNTQATLGDDFDNPYHSNEIEFSSGEGDELAYSSY